MSQELTDRIRKFLLKAPRPEFVRVVTKSGDEKEISYESGDGKRVRWSDVARSVVGMDPASVQCLNENEEILRVETIDQSSDSAKVTDRKKNVDPRLLMHEDPQTAILSQFAAHIADAYKESNNTEFVSNMFGMLLKMYENTEKRLERVEASYRSEFEARIRERLDHMEDGDPKERMIEAFFNAKKEGEQASSSNGASNGSPRVNVRNPQHSKAWGGD